MPIDDPDDANDLEDEDLEAVGEQGEIINMDGDELEAEAAPRRTAPDPGQPTREEVDEHRVDHYPYRSWCEFCVKGGGSGEQHRRGPEGSIPIISADYLIVTKAGVYTRGEEIEKAEVILKILVIKDSKSKYIGAHVVPAKGVGEDRYAAEKMRRDVLWLGYPRVVLKTDNEPATCSRRPRAAEGPQGRRSGGLAGQSASLRQQGQRLRGERGEAGAGHG